MAVLEEALERINLSGEYLREAELYRTKGDLFLKLSDENEAKAEACYRQAIEIARQQQSKIMELRATTSLSKLLIGQGRRDEARELLGNIYPWFTEGFLTQDLQSAARLLQELS